MDAELVRFVREALSSGIPRADIRAALDRAGWSESDIESVLSCFLEADLPLPVPRKKAESGAVSPFVYLAVFVTLYISSVSLGTLWFQFINFTIPDALTTSRDAEAGLTAIRFSTAALLVSFPIYYWLARKIFVRLRLRPEARYSLVRKWLTQFTLFVASVVITVGLISLVYSFLSGELTGRFLLKSLSVGVIAVAVFGYYFYDLSVHPTSGSSLLTAEDSAG